MHDTGYNAFFKVSFYFAWHQNHQNQFDEVVKQPGEVFETIVFIDKFLHFRYNNILKI